MALALGIGFTLKEDCAGQRRGDGVEGGGGDGDADLAPVAANGAKVVVVGSGRGQIGMRLIVVVWRVVHVCYHAIGFASDALHSEYITPTKGFSPFWQ
jgi:hypothetical protein